MAVNLAAFPADLDQVPIPTNQVTLKALYFLDTPWLPKVLKLDVHK